MNEFNLMTKYIPCLGKDKYGEWVIDRENDGTPQHPIQWPFVNYSEMVDSFVQDVYIFEKEHPEMKLTRYGEILNKHNIEWGSKSMNEADVSQLDAQCVMAMIMGAVRAERFCDGALLGFFKDGSIQRWLERLQYLDSQIMY